jgi:tetratricopeptide (TPR) repeat protein
MKTKLITIILALAAFMTLGGCVRTAARNVPQMAGPRYALVIGNTDYQNIENPFNTENDAQDIAAALKGLGFEVDLKLNVSGLQFGTAVGGYVQKLRGDPNSEGFFWYAGHGVHIGDQNYLLPVDAWLESERTLRQNSYSLDELFADFENAGNKVNVVVLDVWRNHPVFLPSSWGEGSWGLAAVQDVPDNQFVMFSTSFGGWSVGGGDSRNSPFAEAFLKYIDSPEPLVLMASDVISETMMYRSIAQRPFSRGSIISDKRYSLNPVRRGAVYASGDEALTFFEEGQLRISDREWDGAIEFFTEAIRLDPQFTRAYLNRGFAYDQKGDYDRAIADYTEVIRLNPQSVAAYLNRGFVYYEKRDYDGAIANYTEVIRLNPNDARPYGYRGETYYEKGDYDRAIADFTEVIRLDPQSVGGYTYRAWAYGEKGDYGRAIADFIEILRIDPNNEGAIEGIELAEQLLDAARRQER